MAYGIIVQNNPVNFVDLLGLWSFSLEFYPGIGPGIVVGQNPDGGLFIKWRVALGFGGGFSVDPKGKSPGWEACRDREHGFLDTGIGYFGEMGFGIGPIRYSREEAAGIYTPIPAGDVLTSYREGGSKFTFEYDFETKWRARGGIVVGAEGYFLQNPITTRRIGK